MWGERLAVVDGHGQRMRRHFQHFVLEGFGEPRMLGRLLG